MPLNERADTGAAVVAAILSLIAAAALWQTREYSSLGALFPRAIGIGLLVSSAFALKRALSGRGRSNSGLAHDGLLRSGLLVLVMVAWIALLESVGFVAASICAFMLLALIANRDPLTVRRLLTFAVISFGIVLAFNQLFVEVLKVQLPRAALGWW